MTPDLSAALNLPFKEQEEFFKKKLDIPTEKWTDLWKDQHAKGFMVAGANNADIVADFRTAVDKAINQGTTLEEFRNDFDDIVAKHGWSYNGSRNWRSEVIYSTNIRSSYAAGRWAQLTDPDQLKVMPYLKYKHGDSRVPRPTHLSWDGVTLRSDDPWWDTHYTPNGWGCKCRVIGATKKEYEKAKAAGKGTAPASPIDPKTGVPVGIDKGWDYNVGKAGQEEGYEVLTNKFETLPSDIARKWMESYVNEPAFEQFYEGEIKGEFPVAVLDEEYRKQIGATSQSVWLSNETLVKNKTAHADLTLHDYRRLPDIIENAQLVVQDGENTLVMLRLGEKIYYAALKTTRTGQRDYMVSLRMARESDIDAIRRKGKIVRDEI